MVLRDENDRNSSYSDFMGQSDKASPYFVFVKLSDRISLYAVSTGQTVRDSPWNQWLVWCGLERSSRGQARHQVPCDPETSRGVLQGLKRHRPFDHTSSCSRRPIWTNQICAIDWQHLSWTSHFVNQKRTYFRF